MAGVVRTGRIHLDGLELVGAQERIGQLALVNVGARWMVFTLPMFWKDS